MMTKNIQIIECPDYVGRGLIQIAESVTELIPKPNSPFVSIDDTNLMQFQFFGYDDQRNYLTSLRINYVKQFQKFFF